MEAPPPFAVPPPQIPKKKSSLGVVLLLLFFGFIFCCGLPTFLFMKRGIAAYNSVSPIVGCSINFSTVQAAIRRYATDHEGKLPPAKTWQTDIRHYMLGSTKNPMLKLWERQGPWMCTDPKGRETGIAFNSALAGKKISEIPDPYGTVMIFEVPSTGDNQAWPYEKPKTSGPEVFGRPRPWITMPVMGGESTFGDDNTFPKSDKSDDQST
jgi:hypothetical protein